MTTLARGVLTALLLSAAACCWCADGAVAEAPVPFNTCDPDDLQPAAEPLRENTLIINGQMTAAGQERDFDRGVANGGYGSAQTTVAFRSVASPLPQYPNHPKPGVRYFERDPGQPYLSRNGQVQYWNNNGHDFFYTAASSDLTKAHEINGGIEQLPLFVPKCAGDAALRMTHNQGLYLHEVITILALPANPATEPWNYDLGVDRLAQTGWSETNARWESLDHWVMLAKRMGKKVIWSEPAQAWRALARDDVANEYFARWGDTLVPMYATNFESPSSGRLMGGAAQWARKVADRHGMAFGASVQSWYFREQTDLGRQVDEGLPTDAIVDFPGKHTGQQPNPGVCCVLDPLNHNNYQGFSFPNRGLRTYEQPSLPPTAENTRRLAQHGRALGATFFQVEGTNGTYKVAANPPGNSPENQGPVNDMAYGSPYLNGVRDFANLDLRQAASRTEITTKPLYQLWNPYSTSHYYTTDTLNGIPREPGPGPEAVGCPTDDSPPPVGRYCYYEYDGKPEITGYLATTRVPGSVALRRYVSDGGSGRGFYYLPDGDPRASDARYGIPPGYVNNGVLGYVMPATSGAQQVPGTQPWYWMREAGQSNGSKHDYFYTSDPVYQRLPAMASPYEYKDFGVNAWLFTHGPADTTAPTITLTGALFNRRDEYLAGGAYGLRISSADGYAGGGDAARGSGVRRVDVSVSDRLAWTTGDLTCDSPAGSCGRVDNWTLSTAEWPGGDQEIRVRVTDQAGNTAEQSFFVFTETTKESDGFGAATLDDDDEPVASASSAGVVFGLSSQLASHFSDPRFQSLGLDSVRLVVENDVVLEALGNPPTGSDPASYYQQTSPPPVTGATALDRRNHPSNQLIRVDRWMNKACPVASNGERQCRYQPLVSFSYDRKSPDSLPTVAEYEQRTRAFRQRYPYVRLYTAWNEMNFKGQPTSRDPARAARLFLNLAGQCDQAACTVAAGSFLEEDKLTRSTLGYPLAAGSLAETPGAPKRTYLDVFRSTVVAQRRPSAWAIHAYRTGNYLNTTELRRFVQRTQDNTAAPLNSAGPNVWLTEQGGLYRLNSQTYRAPNNRNSVAGRGVRALRFLVGNPDSNNQGVFRTFPRITRFYLYNWRGASDFDSGLLTRDGKGTVRKEFYCYRYVTNPQPGDRQACAPSADETVALP